MLNKARVTFSDRIIFSCSTNVEDTGMRLDRFLARSLESEGFSREKVKKMIQEGAVFVNEEPVKQGKFLVPPCAIVTVFLPQVSAKVLPEQGQLDVVYEDNFLAVVNKPAGLTVHPCPSCTSGTLAHRLVSHFPDLADEDEERPGIVHRLDKDTSGLLLVALNEQSREYFSAQFAMRRVYKEYLALVYGVPLEEKGEINAPIGRDPYNKTRMAVVENGKEARTAWRVFYADKQGCFSLVRVRIYTGRTHQIRVHMAHIGHPLLGDLVYTPSLARLDKGVSVRDKALARKGVRDLGEERRQAALQARKKLASLAVSRQMLHAWQLAFFHPYPERIVPSPAYTRGNMPDPALAAKPGEVPLCFRQMPPDDFLSLLERLVCGMLPLVITGAPGCGKSTLLRSFAARGYPTFSADAAVAELYRAKGDGAVLLQSRFGDRFLCKDKSVDKALLGAAMQADPAVKKEVEALLHPLVYHKVQLFFAEAREHGAPFAFVEIPLYFESCPQNEARNLDSSAFGDEVPVVIGVKAGIAARKKRLLAKRGWTLDKIEAVESWQMPEEVKMARCDIVVDNSRAFSDESDGFSAMQPITDTLLEQLNELRRKKVADLVGQLR